MENAELAMIGTHHLDGAVQNEIIIKENYLKAGPWNKKLSKQKTSTSSSIIQPQHPSFQCECFCQLILSVV